MQPWQSWVRTHHRWWRHILIFPMLPPDPWITGCVVAPGRRTSCLLCFLLAGLWKSLWDQFSYPWHLQNKRAMHSDSDDGAGGHRLCLSSVKVFFFSKWEERTAQTESKPLIDSSNKLRRDLAMEVEFRVTQLPYLTGVKVCRKWHCTSNDTCQQLWPTKSYCVAWPIMPRVQNGEWRSSVCVVCTDNAMLHSVPGAITSGLGRVGVGAHL